MSEDTIVLDNRNCFPNTPKIVHGTILSQEFIDRLRLVDTELFFTPIDTTKQVVNLSSEHGLKFKSLMVYGKDALALTVDDRCAYLYDLFDSLVFRKLGDEQGDLTNIIQVWIDETKFFAMTQDGKDSRSLFAGGDNKNQKLGIGRAVKGRIVPYSESDYFQSPEMKKVVRIDANLISMLALGAQHITALLNSSGTQSTNQVITWGYNNEG